MDALSDVLKAVRLTGAVFFDVQTSKPWVAETPPGRSSVSAIFPGAGHLMAYHAVTAGSCWDGALGDAPIQLPAGDIILFPHGDPHVMSSAPGMRSAPDQSYPPQLEGRRPFAISMGTDGGERTDVVGQPPVQYLTRGRMQLAANHVTSGTESVANVAARVGYESEAAFSHRSDYVGATGLNA